MKLNNNKHKLSNLTKGGLTVLISVVIIFTVVKAGSLTPTSSPAATSYTLTDIYNRLNTNAAATEGNHDFAPGASPAGTLYTLTQIYDKIPTIVADTVKLGTPYLGVDGTLVPSGTATGADCLDTKTFYAGDSWTQKTGSLATQTLSAANDTVSAGNYSATTLSAVDADLATGNIKSGITIFGIDGDGNVVNTSTGDAATNDILSGKIAWVDGVARTGMYNASNLTVGTVKSGTSFGVGLTGDYPSATYSLSGDTGATDATAGEICNANEAWTKAGGLLTGTLNPTASTIGVGNTYCGTAGTLLANMDNGSATSGDYPQSVGGVDDYNNNGTMPADSYASTWTTCNEGNSYCGTNDATNADKKDDSTGLVWSIRIGISNSWFSANNCAYPNGLGDGVCNINGEAACKCVKLSEGSMTGCETLGATVPGNSGGWRLPCQKELMQAYIDGSWGNLLSSTNYGYWSATTLSNHTPYALFTYLHNGDTRVYDKTNNTLSVRCVR